MAAVTGKPAHRRGPAALGLLAAAWLFLALAAGPAAWAAAELPQPPVHGYVVDATGSLPASTIADLNDELSSFEQRTTNEIAVAVVPTTGGQDIADYSLALFNRWGVGQQGRDNGVLLVVATNDRRLRLQVGRGLTAQLTDLQAQELVNRTIVPRLKDGDLPAGIAAGVIGVRQALGDDVSINEQPGGDASTPVQTVSPNVDSPFIDNQPFSGSPTDSWSPLPLIIVGALVLALVSVGARVLGGGHMGWAIGGDRCPSCGGTLSWRGDHQRCAACGYSRRMLRNAGLYGSGWGSGWGGGGGGFFSGGGGSSSHSSGSIFGGGSSDGGGASGSFGDDSGSSSGSFGGGSSGGGGASGSW
jgi:uncharacterized protein